MIPRGVLDIDVATLLLATVRSFLPFDAGEMSKKFEPQWGGDRSIMVCQSVRSGLDAVLSSLNWSHGDEILISAATIADIPRIIREHGLVPVPIDVLPDSLGPDIDQLQSRITSRSRAILVAHLFGSRLNLGDVARIAKQNGIVLWEDVAQGYAADDYFGDSEADISFFSFGLIKTQTALGGAICRVRDPALALQCQCVQSKWPLQLTDRFRKKIGLAVSLQILNRHSIFTVLASSLSCLNIDFDEWLSRSVRGYLPSQLLLQLRQRPCGSHVDLLHRRLARPATGWLKAKDDLVRRYCQLLSSDVMLGSAATFPVR